MPHDSLSRQLAIIGNMLPEISRRCLSCGASVRVRALFCPQCGQRLEAESIAPPPPSSLSSSTSKPTENFDALRTRINIGSATQSSVEDEGLPVTAELNERAQRTAPYISSDEMPLPTPPSLAQTFVPETNEDGSSVGASSLPASSPTQTIAPVEVPIADKAGNNRSQSFAATEVVSTNYETGARRHNVVAGSDYEKSSRAERMRGASSAFVEEASDDPGLRFVLIAIALFLLFLVFLFFSHIIG